MSFFDNRYYYLNKRLLSIIGQWPFQSRLKGNIMFAVASFFIFSFSSIQTWGLVAGITDLGIIMKNGSQVLVHSYIIIKLINCAVTNNKMKVLLEDVEETWKMKQSGPEREILQCHAETSRIFTKRFMIAFYTTWVLYIMPWVIARGMYKLSPTNKTYTAKFLYRIEHVLDMDKYYNLLLLHGLMAAFFLLTVSISINAVFTVCTLHICALFECLRYNVERIRSTDPVSLEPNIKDDESYHDLIACVKSHKHALKLSDILSSNYSMAYFFHLGSVVISLSFGSAEVNIQIKYKHFKLLLLFLYVKCLIMLRFKIIMLDLKLGEIISILSLNITQLVHIFSLCMLSQRLTNRSSEVQDIIYSCDWYRMSLRSRRLVMFTLMGANKPCYIKAGMMFVMSMETFSSILKLSLSYFTVLTSLQNEQ
ncbi:odorant receptor 22c-like isoform X1 [Solenopsis invicta]|uniref:odorant receptor 22c-like isoform X1 n=1 Tax=Solenopsis invicta TaxID=13686 RepID=UPI00193D8157|nr:odorant receptor 22c-like isoform X1 [Solenopsis invicta]